MINQKPASLAQRFLPVLKQRCPVCLEGRVFEGTFKMRESCPVCDFIYEREPGYFTGAMYISYGLAVLSVLPTTVILFLLGAMDLWIVAAVAIQLIGTSPLLFRYSRVLWLHLDQMIFPDQY